MTITSDPFINDIRKLCKNDAVMNQLIANSISWADVPSDDDILELDGWRSYQVVKQRAKTAYHRTVRSEKGSHPLRQTVKQVSPVVRKPYLIMKQERTKNVLLANGRVSPIREIVEVVYQKPIEYEEPEIIEMPVQKPIEVQQPIEVQTETTTVEHTITQHNVISKQPSKSKLHKKAKSTPTFLEYQPSFSSKYITPYLPIVMLILLVIMICNMRL
jgi:hypothetical protein